MYGRSKGGSREVEGSTKQVRGAVSKVITSCLEMKVQRRAVLGITREVLHSGVTTL